MTEQHIAAIRSSFCDAIYGDAEAVDPHEQEVVLDAVMAAAQLALDAYYWAGHNGWRHPDPVRAAELIEETERLTVLERYEQVMREANSAKEEWEDGFDTITHPYAVGYGERTRVHKRECPSMVSLAKVADKWLDRLTPKQAACSGLQFSWPTVLTRSEAIALNRRRCGMCAPDLPSREAQRSLARTGGQA